MREQGTQQNRNRFAPTCQTGTNECPRFCRRTTRTSGCHRCLCVCWTEKTTLDPKAVRPIQMGEFLPEQPLLARLDTLIETATAAFLDVLDNSQKPTAKIHQQEAANNNTRTQRPNHHTNRVASPPNTTTTPNPHLPRAEEAVSAHHSSKRSSPCCLAEPDSDARNTPCTPKVH